MSQNLSIITDLDNNVFAKCPGSYLYVLTNRITRVPIGMRWIFNTPTKDTFVLDPELRNNGIECAGLDFLRGQEAIVCLFNAGTEHKLVDGQRLGCFPPSFLVRTEKSWY